MIKRMEISSLYSNAPVLPLGSGFMPNNDPVQIRSIEGLGPVKADASATPFATGRGELFQGSSTGKRNIVLTVGLNPNWETQTMSSLRQLLYRYFMVESWTTLRFFTDELPDVRISGIVESFEPNMFSVDPEIQISILCHKPDFIDVDPTVLRGVVDSGIQLDLDYIGTAPAGFELRIQSSTSVPSYVGNLTILNVVGDAFQEFHLIAVSVNDNLYLQMSTLRTARHVYSITHPDNVEINILAKMGKTGDWPEFLPGQNLLSIGGDTPGLKWTLAYYNRFGGL